MPTVGWILESDWERYAGAKDRVPDPADLLPPAPHFKCPFCPEGFQSRPEVEGHLHAKHTIARPVLVLREQEAPKRLVVREVLQPHEIVALSTSKATLFVDGRFMSSAVDQLPEALSRCLSETVLLTLTNIGSVAGLPVESEYQLLFRVADADKMSNVELAFADHIDATTLSRASIDRFLSDERTSGAAREYADALASYSLGIISKERPDAERLTTPLSQYREHYGSALDALGETPRPLARIISASIRFALNDFCQTEPTGFWELDMATDLLRTAVTPSLDHASSRSRPRRRAFPIDHGIGQVLDLATRLSTEERWSPILDELCRHLASTKVLDTLDRQKVLAVWALSAWRLGARESAREPLSQLAATYPFREWAEPRLNEVST
jgi:hypothetical protein